MKKILTLFISIFLMTMPAHADIQTFTGEGSAVVINDNRGAATRIANKAAKKKALTQAMKSLFYKGQKDEANFNRNKAKLLKGPFPYIKREMQTSNKLDGKLLKIQVELAIEMDELKRLLGKEGVMATDNKAKNKSQFPAVMVIISEEIGGQVNTVPYTTARITEHLIKNEFEVLDQNIVKKNISQEQAVQATNGNLAAANAVALQYGSGIVITGKTAVQASALKSGGLQAYGANITLRAIKADTGDVLATASADGSFPHINAMTGSRKAAEEAAAKAIKKMVKDLEKSLESSTNTIVITINPINYKQLAIVKKMLKRDFKDITAIKQKSYVNKVAKLDLEFQGVIADFADEIALKDFKTFTLEVLQFSPGKVDFGLKMINAQ